MPPAGIAALCFTVVLLVSTAYFIMGGLPLLTLQHDTPVDERFIRRFFDLYYKVAVGASLCACVSYALWGRPFFALGTAGVAAVALLVRRQVIPAMENLGAQIHAGQGQAVQAFRKVHVAAMGVNVTRLVVVVWGLTPITVWAARCRALQAAPALLAATPLNAGGVVDGVVTDGVYLSLAVFGVQLPINRSHSLALLASPGRTP